jgi:RNA polymerase sigma-70 factor, ECF subfamily
MPFADDNVAEAGDGRFLHQGLLGSFAQWRMPLGVTQAPLVRWMARVLLLFATTLLLAWMWAVLSQAQSGRGPWLPVGIAFATGLPWLIMTWRSWQSLGINRVVTLYWGGLPPFRPASSPAEIPPGWSLKGGSPACQQAVAVHVVFDLGVWVLVKMVPVDQESHGASWSWLDARICFKGGAGHHLRALLFNARANQVGSEQVVASSENNQRQWSNLLSSFKTNDQVVGKRGAIRREAGAQGKAVADDSGFAKTVILLESEPSEPPVMPDQPMSAQAFDPSITVGVEGQETGPAVMPIVDVDALLVERVQRGDQRAFEMLVVKYQRRIQRLIARMVRDVDLVEDIAQETFIRAYRALPNFRGESAFYTWLYRIAVNTAKKALIGLRRDPLVTESSRAGAGDDDDADTSRVENELTTGETPESLMASRQIANTVNAAIEALSEDLRQAITLREIEGLSYEEIAEVMACPIGTVRSRIFRARDAIAQRLRPLLDTKDGDRW